MYFWCYSLTLFVVVNVLDPHTFMYVESVSVGLFRLGLNPLSAEQECIVLAHQISVIENKI